MHIMNLSLKNDLTKLQFEVFKHCLRLPQNPSKVNPDWFWDFDCLWNSNFRWKKSKIMLIQHTYFYTSIESMDYLFIYIVTEVHTHFWFGFLFLIVIIMLLKLLEIDAGAQYPKINSNKVLNTIQKTYIGLTSKQGFQKCIAWNPSK